jgi:pantoate kinase
LVLWILLDGADGSNSGSLGADLVLESNREEVSFLGGEVLILVLDNLLKVVNHIVESLGLLGNSGHKNVFFQ